MSTEKQQQPTARYAFCCKIFNCENVKADSHPFTEMIKIKMGCILSADQLHGNQ